MSTGARTDVVELEDVWKAYPRWEAGTRTLRGLASKRSALFARGGPKRWALRAVSFAVPRGGSIGIVGQNGAGKSTCLRVAAGLSRPTRGRIRRPEDTLAVLSLGDFFDTTLTGRENAVTAAIIAGLRSRAARQSVRQVLEFAELEKHGDAPVRTYSEGMKLRLAFGVIAQLRPAVLLVDEVLAVGDLRFQAKCLERMRELREDGMTLVLATHDLDQICSECDQAVWLQAGAVRASGEALAVVGAYRDAMRSATVDMTPPPPQAADGGLELRRNRYGSQEVTITGVTLTREGGEVAGSVLSGSGLAVSLEVQSHIGPVNDAIVAIAVRRVSDGVVCFDSNTDTDGVSLAIGSAPTSVQIAYEHVDLLPGDYDVEVGVYAAAWEYAYDIHFNAYPLHVVGQREAGGVVRAPRRWFLGSDHAG